MSFSTIIANEVANATHGKGLIVMHIQTDFMTPDRISILSAARGDNGALLATQEFDKTDVDALKAALCKAQFA